MIKNIYWSYPLFVSDFMTLDFSRQVFKKPSNIKFHENPSSRVAKCGRTDGQTDRQTDMTKLIVAFRNFAKAPKNSDKTVLVTVVETSYEVVPTFFPIQTQIKVWLHVT